MLLLVESCHNPEDDEEKEEAAIVAIVQKNIFLLLACLEMYNIWEQTHAMYSSICYTLNNTQPSHIRM